MAITVHLDQMEPSNHGLHNMHRFGCLKMYGKYRLVSKTLVFSCHSKRQQIILFQDRLLLNAGQMYCRMLEGEHSAILLTFLKLQFVIKIFVLSIFSGRLR